MTGRLVDLGLYPVASGYTEAFWAPARGGIALVRAAPPVFSLDLAQTATGGYAPGQISALAAIEYAAYAAGLMRILPGRAYPAASGLPAVGDPGCPAVWVGDSTGTELAELAAGGQASATLVLTADITAGAATETVWGWLEGSGTPARTSSSHRRAERD